MQKIEDEGLALQLSAKVAAFNQRGLIVPTLVTTAFVAIPELFKIMQALTFPLYASTWSFVARETVMFRAHDSTCDCLFACDAWLQRVLDSICFPFSKAWGH